LRKWADFINEGHIDKELTREKPIIAIMGCYQIGKSTLLNCLLHDYVALTGKGLATTSLTARYRYGTERSIAYRSRKGQLVSTDIALLQTQAVLNDISEESAFHVEARFKHELLHSFDVVDTPGFNANESDTHKTMQSMSDVHYVLFMMPNRSFTQIEKSILTTLYQRKIPFSVIMNCVNGRREERWLPHHQLNQAICQENSAWLQANILDNVIQIEGRNVFPFNAMFYWSQQNAFESSFKYIDRPETVHKHIAGLFSEEGINYTSASVIEQSNVPQLTEHLQKMVERYDPITHAWRGMK